MTASDTFPCVTMNPQLTSFLERPDVSVVLVSYNTAHLFTKESTQDYESFISLSTARPLGP